MKQVHVVLPMSAETVALLSLYYADIKTVIDETKDAPSLTREKDAKGREIPEIRLSTADFNDAKGCLPSPNAS